MEHVKETCNECLVNCIFWRFVSRQILPMWLPIGTNSRHFTANSRHFSYFTANSRHFTPFRAFSAEYPPIQMLSRSNHFNKCPWYPYNVCCDHRMRYGVGLLLPFKVLSLNLLRQSSKNLLSRFWNLSSVWPVKNKSLLNGQNLHSINSTKLQITYIHQNK